MHTAMQYLDMTASLITVGGIVFLIQLIFKWQNSPRFSVGVLPTTQEQKEEGLGAIGKTSHVDEFVFDKKFLAQGLSDETELAALKFNNDSSRSVYRDDTDRIRLPIIIQNDGSSEAKNYTLVLSFSHPGIRIADIKTESLQVGALYTQDDSFVENKSLSAKLPAQELRAIYQDLNLVGDYLGLEGALAGGSFEAIFLKLYVPRECQDFVVLFKIDCPDFFYYQRQVRGQHINIFHGRNH